MLQPIFTNNYLGEGTDFSEFLLVSTTDSCRLVSNATRQIFSKRQHVDVLNMLGLTSENFCQPRIADTAPAARRQSAEAQIVIEDDSPPR